MAQDAGDAGRRVGAPKNLVPQAGLIANALRPRNLLQYRPPNGQWSRKREPLDCDHMAFVIGEKAGPHGTHHPYGHIIDPRASVVPLWELVGHGVELITATQGMPLNQVRRIVLFSL